MTRTTHRVGLRSDFVPNGSRNEVDPRSFPLGNGVDGTKSFGTESTNGNEVAGTKSFPVKRPLRAAADQLQEASDGR